MMYGLSTVKSLANEPRSTNPPVRATAVVPVNNHLLLY